jgi:ABC-type transport system substrate-binding protein
MFNSPNLAPAANVSLWNPPGYAELVAKAASEIDQQKQIELYHQLQTLLLEEMPQITVDHLPLFFLGNEAAKSLIIGPSGIDDYKQIAL